jgi:hypothetical protein
MRRDELLFEGKFDGPAASSKTSERSDLKVGLVLLPLL